MRSLITPPSDRCARSTGTPSRRHRCSGSHDRRWLRTAALAPPGRCASGGGWRHPPSAARQPPRLRTRRSVPVQVTIRVHIESPVCWFIPRFGERAVRYPHQQWGCVSLLGLCLVAGSPGHPRSTNAPYLHSRQLPSPPTGLRPCRPSRRRSGPTPTAIAAAAYSGRVTSQPYHRPPSGGRRSGLSGAVTRRTYTRWAGRVESFRLRGSRASPPPAHQDRCRVCREGPWLSRDRGGR